MRTIHNCLLTCLLALWGHQLSAQEGFSIAIETTGFEENEVYLVFYLGENQYIKDTALSEDGLFTFEGDEALMPGFYMIVFPPDNKFTQLLVDEGDTDIKVTVSADNLTRPVTISGSEDTRMYYDYADFISSRRPEADELRKERETAPEKRKKEIDKRLEMLNSEVESHQQKILKNYPESLTAMVIKSNMALEVPEFEGSEEEKAEKVYTFYKEHYFDNIDLSDERVVRTPFLNEKLNYYLDKLTYQQPDSISAAADYILSQMQPDEENFRATLSMILNKYANSKIVGMDAVYVHLVDEYYARGLAPWVDEETLGKIIRNANTLRPLLIGKTAPDLEVLDRSKQKIRLHEIESPYTVLYFWDPECGHCKRSIPRVIEFYEQYKDKGVEVFAICTKLGEDAGSCWDAIDERGMDIWVNAYDPLLKSRFKQIYDVRSTPQVFVLDSDKKIVMKRIGAEQLPEVMEHLMKDQ